MSTVAEIEARGTLTFHQALTQAEAQARSTLDVALHERLSCAVALVKTGAVFQEGDGHTWTVASKSKPGNAYRLNGQGCQCEDAHYRAQKRCKHALAVYLSQRVLSLMQQPPVPVVPDAVPEPFPDNDPEPAPEMPAPASPAVPLPEAPVSITLRSTLHGHEVLVTLRGTDFASVQAQVEQASAWLRSQTPTTPAADTPQCPTHGAKKPSTKGKGYYCPHKLADGSWCKG